MTTEELKPCPACEGTKIIRGSGEDSPQGRLYYNWCYNADCLLAGPYRKDKGAADKAWNSLPRRESLPEQPDDDQALKREVYDLLDEYWMSSDPDEAVRLLHYHNKLEQAGWDKPEQQEI